MVNTFLVAPPSEKNGYKESARYLDRQRLGKQRVEAYQILCLIEDLTYLARKYKKPIPENCEKWREWIRKISRIYKSKDYKFIVKEGRYIKANKTLKRTDCEEGQRLVGLGFVFHPAVLMWLQWPEALKLYINSHIEVWVEQGYKNNMKLYEVQEEVEHPPWVYDENLIKNHRGALLKKEIDRDEPSHYQEIDIFLKAPKWNDYIWPLVNKEN